MKGNEMLRKEISKVTERVREFIIELEDFSEKLNGEDSTTRDKIFNLARMKVILSYIKHAIETFDYVEETSTLVSFVDDIDKEIEEVSGKIH